MAGVALSTLIIGILLFITFMKGNYAAVFGQINQDLFGSGSGSGFLVWAAAILAIALLGSILQIPKAAKLFIILIIVVYLIKTPNLWAQLESGITGAQAAAASPTDTSGTGQAETATGTPTSQTGIGASSSSASSGASTPSSSPSAFGNFSNTFNSLMNALGVTIKTPWMTIGAPPSPTGTYTGGNAAPSSNASAAASGGDGGGTQ